jgi:hypothetical protein
MILPTKQSFVSFSKLASKFILLILTIFILINIDYSINSRSYDIPTTKNNPSIEVISDNDSRRVIMVKSNCGDYRLKSNILHIIDESKGVIINPVESSRHSKVWKDYEITIIKNKKPRIWFTCDVLYLPVNSYNYNY